MNAPLYEAVNQLTIDLINASDTGNPLLGQKSYNALTTLCTSHEGTDLDHPLQWEALGDFSEDHTLALQAYQKGLFSAQTLHLMEHCASIKLAMAESYFEQRNLLQAQCLASEAHADSLNTNDSELKMAISELIEEIVSEYAIG